MRKSPYATPQSFYRHAFVLACAFAAFSVNAQNITITSTSDATWKPVQNASGVNLMDTNATGGLGISDQQTGQGVADLVGNANVPLLQINYGNMTYGSPSNTFTKIVNIGNTTTTTTNITSSTTATHMAFAVRLNVASETNKGVLDTGALKQVTYIGFDFNNNSKIDLVLGLNLKPQNSSDWTIVISDATDSLSSYSPNTSDISTQLYSITAKEGINFSYFRATDDQYFKYNSNNPPTDTSSTYDQDVILTFAIPYQDFLNAVRDSRVMGSTWDPSSGFRVTVGTSNTENVFNQDMLSDYGTPIVFSREIRPDGSPVPEPSTFISLAALLGPVLAVASRRRLRQRSTPQS